MKDSTILIAAAIVLIFAGVATFVIPQTLKIQTTVAAENVAADSAETEIRRILEKYYDLARTNDRAALMNYSRSISAPEYRYSSELGVLDKDATLRLFDARDAMFLTAEFKDFEAQIHDDAAIVKYRDVSTIKDADGKARANSLRFTNVWVRRDGRWLIVAEHSSRLEPPKLLPRHPLADSLAKK